MRPRIGVLLSGCGALDGSDVHEATLALLALDRRDCEAVCLSPDRAQAEVLDHRTGRRQPEARRCLSESARLARGSVRPLTGVRPEDLEAGLIVGGGGAALTLSDFASQGPDCTIDPQAADLLAQLHARGRPLGAIGLGVVPLADLLGWEHVTLTTGSDEAAANAIEEMGARYLRTAPDGVAVDRARRVVSTPGYLSARTLSEVERGVEALVEELLRLRVLIASAHEVHP